MTRVELRRAMAAGIAFVILFVVGVFVTFGNAPNIKKHDSDAVAAGKYVAKLSDSGARHGILIGAYLLLLAAIAFVWFSRALSGLVVSVLAERFIGGVGVLGAAGIATGAMTSAVVAGAVSFGGEPVPRDGDTIRVIMDLSFPLMFVVFALSSAAIAATIALRGDGLPSAVRYTAWLAVLGAIFGVIFLPMAITLLWFLALAIVVLRQPGAAVATTKI